MQTKTEARIKERFPKDVAEHEITVLHCDGLYRHYRCQKPGTWNMGFDIVTWPGFLAMTGDMGEYVFSRTADMIHFMRRSAMSYGYAEEKCVAHDGELKVFSEDAFRQALLDIVDNYDHDEQEEVEEKVEEIRSEYSIYEDPHDAYRAMYESGLWDCDLPSCKEYSYHFLWALHAIKWLCDRVDTEPANAD